MVRRAFRWLSEAGVAVPVGDDGEPQAVVELSAALAEAPEGLRAELGTGLHIAQGDRLYLG
jgi:hypothetical protein